MQIIQLGTHAIYMRTILPLPDFPHANQHYFLLISSRYKQKSEFHHLPVLPFISKPSLNAIDLTSTLFIKSFNFPPSSTIRMIFFFKHRETLGSLLSCFTKRLDNFLHLLFFKFLQPKIFFALQILS